VKRSWFGLPSLLADDPFLESVSVWRIVASMRFAVAVMACGTFVRSFQVWICGSVRLLKLECLLVRSFRFYDLGNSVTGYVHGVCLHVYACMCTRFSLPFYKNKEYTVLLLHLEVTGIRAGFLTSSTLYHYDLNHR
jgi:hypothetical protein